MKILKGTGACWNDFSLLIVTGRCSEVGGLAKLDHLEQVDFQDSFCHDHHTVDAYAALMFQMALCAPDVDVVMEKSNVANSQNHSLLTFDL